MDKKKYDVTIAGVEMSIISDEREEFVQKLVAKLDKQITDITIQNKRCSKLDAAILVSLDLSCEKAKAEKRVRNLEAQIALYDANLRRMREENIKLKNAMLGTNGTTTVQEEDNTADDTGITQLSLDESDAEADEKESATDAEDARRESLRQIADFLGKKKEDAAGESAGEDSAKADPGEADGDDAEKKDKLRQIESLLRKNSL